MKEHGCFFFASPMVKHSSLFSFCKETRYVTQGGTINVVTTILFHHYPIAWVKNN